MNKLLSEKKQQSLLVVVVVAKGDSWSRRKVPDPPSGRTKEQPTLTPQEACLLTNGPLHLSLESSSFTSLS